MATKSKAVVLSVADRCRNILCANWQAYLNTVKADATGSKNDIHSSKVQYLFKRGKPYVWVKEGDLHNMNIIIDERGSLSISNIIPGSLMGLLRSLKKLPGRVALTGDVIPLTDDKVQMIMENLKDSILAECDIVRQASYAASAILTSASINCKSRSESLQEIIDQNENYAVYKFNIRTCTYVDGSEGTHGMELNDIAAPKADPLLSFSEKLIDGINQSHTRRRALMLFCFEYFNANARDALMLSIDRNGFDILAKVPEQGTNNGLGAGYAWKEFRFTFKEEARDIDTFCRLLVELEEESLQNVKSYSGLG